MIQYNQGKYDDLIDDLLDQYVFDQYSMELFRVNECKVKATKSGIYVEGIVEDDWFYYECAFDLTNHGTFYRRGCGCDCEYSRCIPCEHCAFLMKALKDMEIDHLPFSYSVEEEEDKVVLKQPQIPYYLRRQLENSSLSTKWFVDEMKLQQQNKLQELIQSNHYQIQLEVREQGDQLGIGFKVGYDKFYIVKNIETFLEAIRNHTLIRYGKQLAFVHSKQCFEEDAQVHLSFMEYCYNRQQEMSRSYYYDDPRISRTIPLLPQFMDCFFDTYQDLELDEVELVEELIPLSLHVHEEGAYYCFSLQEEIILTKQYAYIMNYDDCLHLTRLKWDEDGKCRKFLGQFEFHLPYPFVIEKKDYPMFYRYVFSDIKDYFHVDYEFELEESKYQTTRIYGDVEGERAYFQVYYYDEDENRIPAFQNNRAITAQQELVEQTLLSVASYEEEAHRVYMDLNEEDSIAFLQEGIYRLNPYAEIYISDALKRIGHKVDYHIQVGVSIQNDLLELTIDSEKIPKMELAEVLAKYKRKKKYHRLRNGDIIDLQSQDVQEVASLLEDYHISTKQIQQGSVTLDKNRMFSIEANKANLKHIQLQRSASFQKQLQQFYEPVKEISFSPYYDQLLRDYQKEGVKWLMVLQQYGFHGILADDMGLGKTLQVICMLEQSQLTKVSIVVCPASLIYNWQDECHKFAPNLKVNCICGSQIDRKEQIKHASEYQLLVTSYDYLRRDIELYENTLFDYVILDESQYIKNLKTKNAQCVKQLQGTYRLALSGTPIENTLAELWSVFDFLMPNYLFPYHYFRTAYENKIVKEQDEETSKKLQQLVAPFILRRNKKDVLTELPDKVETIQKISFNEEEEQLYYANLAQVNAQLQELLHADSINKVAILAMMTRLRQICCEPRMIYENIQQPSSKLKACFDLILNYKQNSQKVLVFSSFTSLFPLLEEEFHLQGIRYYKITGETKKDLRKQYVEGFQNNEVDVFLISLKAGGTGLNLTAAEAVIHFDPWWNLSAQNQASDRAYRMGQTKNVQVHKLIMKDSIEEKIVQLQEQKQALADAFVKDSETSISTLSKEEILRLFSIES